MASLVVEQRLLHRRRDDRSAHRRHDERRGAQRRQVAEQRRSDCELDRRGRAHRPWRAGVETVRIGDADRWPFTRAEHESEGRHLLVDDRLCVRRR